MATPSDPSSLRDQGAEGQHEERRDQGAEGQHEEQPPEVGGGRFVMPEDGYEWKKYGQKYIRNIQMIRSYFKCRNNRCNAKKRVEWNPSNPTNIIRIVYDGQHSHGARSDSDQASSSGNLEYDLNNQVLGRSNNNEPS